MTKRLLAKVLSVVVAAVMIVGMFPIIATADEQSNRVVDISTMDNWKTFFGTDIKSTENAGGVWTDKSVFTDAEAFPDSVKMLDDENNFLVALSAIASNKEIVGYSTIPTDTMLVLDLSGSMDDSADELVIAANQAIKSLLDTNNNNRVGVVLYSGSNTNGTSTYAQGATVLLSIDRYTTADTARVNLGTNRNPNWVYVPEYIELDNGEIVINSSVRTSNNTRPASVSKDVQGATYIQSGLFAALREFEKSDTTVTDNFQDGQKRKPILVLMSDGDPTTATSRFAAVDEVYKKQIPNPNFNNRRPESDTNPRYLYVDTTESDAGRGTATSESMGFLTQLTASYVRNRVEAHYECEGESLFYTLGLGVDGGDNNTVTVAETVLDTTQTTTTLNGYWDTYMGLNDGVSMELTVPSTSGNGTKTVSVYKNSNAVDRNYVTQYFEANDSADMIDAFSKIVEEIIIQSRYYATDLDGGNPDFAGYLTFEDVIGEYMEVKDIKGILLGDTLFSGAMMTSKITNGSDGLGTIDDPTALGDEFIRAVKTRLGITDNKEAHDLVTQAWNHGQLSYSKVGGVETFSNYIGWYAKADGSYAGFWHEGVTQRPADAVYANRSYGFLGQAEGNIKDSDMMYMSVQVHTNLDTGEQTLLWKIPAALMPMVTYKVTLQGKSIETATDVDLEIIDAEPIRLLFETGLRDEINELSVAQITDPKHIDSDGITRRFWSNQWDKTGNDPNNYLTTTSHFHPSEQNERYYYTENSEIYVKSGNDYNEITDSNYTFDPDTKYYHARWIFTTADRPTRLYEVISDESLAKRAFEDGRWIIPLGNIYRYYTDLQIPKTENKTESIEYRNYPHIGVINDELEVVAGLGNNGLIRVTPAQGIKLSKMIDTVAPGASDQFKFRITLAPPAGAQLEDEYPIVIAELDKVVGDEGTVSVNDNTIEVDLSANQTVYITGLPTGTDYLVQELDSNDAYKVKNVHVNGVAAAGLVGVGSITAYTLDDVDFINTPISEGNLVISKTVEHPYGANYTVPADITFTARVTLTNSRDTVANQSYTLVTANGRTTVTTDADGRFTVQLKSGETVAIEGIPERTQYTIEEIDMPDGFTLDSTDSMGLSGTIAAESNADARLVNEYWPDAVSPDVGIVIGKDLTGRDWNNDSFEFVVSRIDMAARATYVEIAKGNITADGDQLLADLDNEVYTAPGTYHYVITETAGNSNNGITYDTVERRFHVEVTDTDMDGKLEIASVTGISLTTVTGNAADGWTVSAEFTNSYAPIYGSVIEIAVDKRMTDNNFALNGFRFALYDETDTDLIHESTLTNGNGRATFRIAYTAADAGKTVKYVLREVYTGISGMTYDSATYDVTVRIVDNGDGTTSAYSSITPTGSTTVVAVPTFTNTYDPENGELIIAGEKKLDGRVQNAGEFTFNLYETEAADTPIADADLIDTAVNAANGDFIFDMLTFDAAGDYFFAVTESKGRAGGVTYDETIHRITVRVTDNGGKLEAAIISQPQGGIVFNNTYTVDKLEVPLNATKNINGRPIREGEFSFELKDSDGTVLQTKPNVGTAISFDAIEYTEAGDYTYTVSEVVGDANGVTYDRSVFNITVNVVDNGRGRLIPTVTIRKNGFVVTSMAFVNNYAPAPVPVSIDGIKTFTGRDTDLQAGEFKFTLANAITSQVIAEAYNDANGDFVFEPVMIRSAGTYHYRVTENNTEMTGVSYDRSVYELIIVVVDDGDGQLVVDEANSTMTKNGAPADSIEFVNTYKAMSTGVTLEGVKNLEGRDIEDGEFTFKLFDENEVELQSKTNVGNTITFDAITYDQAGVFTYTVIEDDSAQADGVEYDPTVYKVTVTVTDNNDGHLVADTKIKVVDGEDSDIVFNNVFTPADIQVKLNIQKLLENKTGEAIGLDGFKFKVVGEGIDETLTSDENGKADLTVTLTAEQIGETLTFSITEINTGIEGMEYSTVEHIVTVTVGVDNKGVLTAELTLDEQETDEVVAEFTNTYKGKNEAPKTGDYRNLWMWVALLFISGSGVIATSVLRKKQDSAR